MLVFGGHVVCKPPPRRGTSNAHVDATDGIAPILLASHKNYLGLIIAYWHECRINVSLLLLACPEARELSDLKTKEEKLLRELEILREEKA